MASDMIDLDVLLCWGGTYKHVNKGEVIFHEGTDGRFYYQLVEGRIKWVNVDDSGKEFVQKFVEEGESFGDLPLLDDGPYVATAIAEKDSLVIRLTKGMFLQLLRENHTLHYKFTRLMTERLRQKFTILKDIASQNPERQIFSILHQYKKDHSKSENEKLKIELTRQEIADMTGLRVETVIRAIRHLHDKGTVRIEKGKVYC